MMIQNRNDSTSELHTGDALFPDDEPDKASELSADAGTNPPPSVLSVPRVVKYRAASSLAITHKLPAEHPSLAFPFYGNPSIS